MDWKATTDDTCARCLMWGPVNRDGECDGCHDREDKQARALAMERLGAALAMAGLAGEIARLNGASMDGSSCTIDSRRNRAAGQRAGEVEWRADAEMPKWDGPPMTTLVMPKGFRPKLDDFMEVVDNGDGTGYVERLTPEEAREIVDEAVATSTRSPTESASGRIDR